MPTTAGVELLYDYDRNALVDSRRIGDALIALTRAGHLLRFSLPDLTFDRERISVQPFTSLGSEGGQVLAARTDGAVFRVDAGDLALTRTAQFPGRVEWVGSYQDAGEPVYVAVVDDRAADNEWPRQLPVMDSKGHRWMPPHGADVVHLDREQRLWIGTDNGEWGGHIARIDLRTGRVRDYFAACRRATATTWAERFRTAIELLWEEHDYWSGCDGVYGFVERANGEIWAYGGTSHMGLNSGFIARVGEDGITILGNYEDDSNDAGREPPAARPSMPITHILERSNGALLVQSYGRLFETSGRLDPWSLLDEIDLRYLPGRPDAVGAYPAVKRIDLVGEKPLDAVFTTLRDGLVRVRPDSVTNHALPDQLGATDVVRVAASSMGLIAVDGRAYWEVAPPWLLGDQKWNPLSFSPGDEWIRQQVFTDRARSLFALFSTNSSPQLATVKLGEEAGEVIAKQSRERLFGSAFATPDARWWATDGEQLLHFSEAGWREVAAIPARGPRQPHEYDFYYFQTIEVPAQPWLLLDRGHGARDLWRFEYSPQLENVRLNRLSSLGELQVYSALALESGDVLLATNRGLRSLDLATEQLRPADIDPGQHGRVRVLARDGSAGSGSRGPDSGSRRTASCEPSSRFPRRGIVRARSDRRSVRSARRGDRTRRARRRTRACGSQRRCGSALM